MNFKTLDSLFARNSQTFTSHALKQPSHNLRYWEVMFRTGYYLALIPYKFERKGSDWLQTTNRFQKKTSQLFMLLHFLSLLGILKQVIFPGVSSYFNQAEKVSSILTELIFIYKCWFKSHEFLKVFQHVMDESQLNKYRKKNDNVILTSVSILLVLGLAYGLDALDHFSSGDWTWSYIYEARANAFKIFLGGFDIFDDYDTVYVRIFIILYSIIIAFYKLYNAFADLCPIWIALQFKSMVSKYLCILRTEEDPLKVWASYKHLKESTEKINTAVGLFIFTYFMGSIPFFATDIVVVVNKSANLATIVQALYYLLTSFAVALIMAYAQHLQASATRSWIFREEVQCKLPGAKLQSILPEVCCEQDSIALSGAGMFRINYGFIGTAVSMVLTYAVLAFQLQAAEVDDRIFKCQN